MLMRTTQRSSTTDSRTETRAKSARHSGKEAIPCQTLTLMKRPLELSFKEKLNRMPKLVLNESGKRLLRDLKNLKKDPPAGIAASPIDNDIYVVGLSEV